MIDDTSFIAGDTTTDKDQTSSAIAPSFTLGSTETYRIVNGRLLDSRNNDVSITTSAVAHARFLGASVASFNASLGWNGDRSNCTITLGEDYDETFEVPVVGSPQFFSLSDTSDNVIWKFNGIVRKITRDVNSSSRTFTVELESPNVILEAAGLVSSDFQGQGASTDASGGAMTTFTTRNYSWNGIQNIINAFGFWENDQYGVVGAGIGMAEVNEIGMPWKKLLIAVNEIINRTGVNGYSISNNVLGGSLAYSSSSYLNGSPYWYALNMDEMVTTLVEAGLPNFYRVDDVTSLLKMIQDLCEAANCQWFCTLEENTFGILSTYSGEPVHGIITIKAIPLTKSPKLGTITEWGLTQEGDTNKQFTKRAVFPDVLFAYTDDQTKKLTTSQLGLELADITVGKMVVGGKRSYMYEYGRPNLYMYWGSLKPLGEAQDDLPLITPLLSPTSDADVIPVDCRHIYSYSPSQTGNVGIFEQGKKYWGDNRENLPPTIFKGIYYASILEIRFALQSQEAWENYLNEFRQKKVIDLGIHGDLGRNSATNIDQGQLAYLKSLGKDGILDNYNTSLAATQAASEQNDLKAKEINALYNAVMNTARHYGTDYMVPMPVGAYTWRSESNELVDEWNTSSSAYTEGNIGANAPRDPKFLDDNGRTVGYSLFPSISTYTDLANRNITSVLDFSRASGDKITMIGQTVYLKTQVDPKTYYLVIPTPRSYTNGDYGNIVSNISFRFPELLTSSNPFLGTAPFGKPTTLIYGFYSDVRGGIPFAHITLPEMIPYTSGLGLKQEFDAINVFAELIYKNSGTLASLRTKQSEDLLVGTDRAQTPCAPGAIDPLTLSLPLQSNRFHYGPWIPTLNNYIAGKVEIEFDDSLVPENFLVTEYGLGIEGMDNAGFAKSFPDNLSYFVNETGSFTLAGASKINLGQQLVEGGPYVTDINVSFTPTELTTSINMKTWSLDFGKTKKFLIDRLQRLSKSSLARVKTIRDRRTSAEMFRRSYFSSPVPDRFRGHSSSHIMAGYVQDTYLSKDGVDSSFKQATTSILPVHDFIARANNSYTELGACSLDALWAPFSTNIHYQGSMPHFESGVYKTNDDARNANGLTPKGGVNVNNFPSGVPNIGLLARGSGYPPDLNIKLSYSSDDFESQDVYANGGFDIRSMGNRVPSYSVGHGFDVNGSTAPSGQPNFRWDTSTWKAGPNINVWDDTKKVWYGGFPLLTGLLRQTLTAPSRFGVITESEVVRYVINDQNKIQIVEPSGVFKKIYCDDPTFGSSPIGSVVTYSCIDGKNRVIYVGCGADAEAKRMIADHG